MLTRRHIRVKVLQSLYAFYQTESQELEKQEKFLLFSIHQMQELHALMLHLLVALRNHAENYQEKSKKKFLATDTERNPSRNFVDNKAIDLIEQDEELSQYLKNKKLSQWEDDDEYVTLLFNELRSTEWYLDYLNMDKPSFKEDREICVRIYKEIIAPNDKLYDYLEDKRLTWIDDFPLVNTSVVRSLGKLSAQKSKGIFSKEVFKDEDDRKFALDLLRKVILNDDKLSTEIDGKTPNWDRERIAELDMIILKMGIAEFLYFPSIPIRVTINEYLEVAKEYSTPKSSIFINGILDNVVKEYSESNKLNKIGRGLT